MFSIWVLTPRSEGGMGFSPKENGELKLCASVIVLFMELVIPVGFLKQVGYVRGACISFVLFSISISMIWLPSRLNNSFLGFVSLLIALVTSRISISVIRIAYFIMVKNVTTVSIRGRFLAIDAALVMITRTASQVIFGWFFSWSLSNLKKSDGNISFPFNEPFTFYVISFFGMLGAISVSMCSMDAEKP